MYKRCIILIVIFSMFLILVQYITLPDTHIRQIYPEISYPIIDTINDNIDFVKNSGFTVFEYDQAKIEETKLEHDYDITAILLHWQRLGGVRRTVRHLLHTGLFKQIIIWNNNPEMNLTVYHFLNNFHSIKNIHIVNSKLNLKDKAKYQACAQATTRACFYVDDDWNTAHYTRSLVASFRSDPNLLHSVTDPYTYYTNLVWTYFDKTIGLHTGFSWIGCGSIFLRQHAQRHLQLLDKYLKKHPGKKLTDLKQQTRFVFVALIDLSDVFFSIWLNNIPVQMNTDIRPQPSRVSFDYEPFAFTPHFGFFQYKSSVYAIRILEHALRFDQTENDDHLTFPRQQNRRFPYYIKSSSFNDDFIFYSNVLPFDFRNISFNITQDFRRGTRRNLPDGPNSKYFCQHTTYKILDDDLSTCWYANRAIYSDDFFAIDFLHIRTNVIFTLAVAHSPLLQRNLDVRISFDGLRWRSYQSLKGTFTKRNRTLEQHVHTYLFNSGQFNPGFQSFRYISFRAIEDSDHRFQICEIQIVSKMNITKLRRHFQRLQT
jgi:hypothetical protein